MTLCSHHVSDADDSYKAVPSLPFMTLIRALVTHPASSPGRVAVHDWWLSVLTHASSHWHPVLKVGSLLP